MLPRWRIIKGEMPDPAGRRRHNKQRPTPLYFARCDCGYASDHLTKADAEHCLAKHAAMKHDAVVADPYGLVKQQAQAR